MAVILGSITLAAIALRALWRKVMGEDIGRAHATARQIKLSTNILITCAQAAGYIAELLAGTRTTLPATGSTTASPDSMSPSGVILPGAASFDRRARDVTA